MSPSKPFVPLANEPPYSWDKVAYPGSPTSDHEEQHAPAENERMWDRIMNKNRNTYLKI